MEDVGKELETFDKGLRDQIVAAQKADKTFKITDEKIWSLPKGHGFY